MTQTVDALLHRNRNAFTDLLKRAITNYHYLGGEGPFEAFRAVTHYDLERAIWKLEPLARPLTLLTKAQLDLIEEAVVSLENRSVPGDYIEAGIWRGGAVVFMRAMLDAYGIEDRKVFAADSFAGIPKNVKAINDPVDNWSDRWVASLEDVQQNIARFGMLDEKIRFVVGFFAESLSALTEERFALVRLDSDSYDSVETSLDYLYPLTSKGGIVIIDDWHLPGCQMAVRDYRERFGIGDPIKLYDGNAYWVKQQEYGSPPLPTYDG
jgi:hypothetical protein